jgi:A/G-specific adenine glycosylase
MLGYDGGMTLAHQVVHWQRQHGRQHLPWQNTRDAYRIWLSEVMLQQTQVATVIDYFERFVKKFPTVVSLASAHEDEVLALWSGLGYYSRARNLHRCAKIVVDLHGGSFPNDMIAMQTLPGIGRSTAAAILAFSDHQLTPIMDGNVKRVFARAFGVLGYPGQPAVMNQLWLLAEQEIAALASKPGELKNDDVPSYTQGLMDLGATICNRNKPLCERCPLVGRCVAYKNQSQASIPARKPKKIVPLRKERFFVLARDEQSVWLEKQPDAGIWGGLFSMPKIADDVAESDVLEWIARWSLARFGVPLNLQAVETNGFKHAFTHYKLEARCWRVQVNVTAQSQTLIAADGARGDWFDSKAIVEGALPQPIKKWLIIHARELAGE